MRTCLFEVPGTPVAQPRPRVTVRGKNAVGYVPAKHPVHAYRGSIVAAFCCLNEEYKREFLGPVSVAITFWFPRPQAMQWKSKPMLPVPKTTRPDIDNLSKSVLDALEGYAYDHDAQVVELRAAKWYVQGGGVPRTGICISEVEVPK